MNCDGPSLTARRDAGVALVDLEGDVRLFGLVSASSKLSYGQERRCFVTYSF